MRCPKIKHANMPLVQEVNLKNTLKRPQELLLPKSCFANGKKKKNKKSINVDSSSVVQRRKGHNHILLDRTTCLGCNHTFTLCKNQTLQAKCGINNIRIKELNVELTPQLDPTGYKALQSN